MLKRLKRFIIKDFGTKVGVRNLYERANVAGRKRKSGQKEKQKKAAKENFNPPNLIRYKQKKGTHGLNNQIPCIPFPGNPFYI